LAKKFANEICVPFASERGQDNAQPGSWQLASGELAKCINKGT